MDDWSPRQADRVFASQNIPDRCCVRLLLLLPLCSLKDPSNPKMVNTEKHASSALRPAPTSQPRLIFGGPWQALLLCLVATTCSPCTLYTRSASGKRCWGCSPSEGTREGSKISEPDAVRAKASTHFCSASPDFGKKSRTVRPLLSLGN